MHVDKVWRTALFVSAIFFVSSCGQSGAAAKLRAIDAALKPLEQIEVPTGSRLNIGPDGVPVFRRLEAAGLIRFMDVPQGFWDNFATRTFLEGSRPFRVLATQKLNDVALNPRWKPPTQSVALSEETIAQILEPDWNFYARRKVFLGANCFGGATSFARAQGFCALELISDYPEYSALAADGLINLAEISLADIPPSAVPPYLPKGFERAARVSLTSAGTPLADVDTNTHTATFVFGTFRVEQVSKNIPIAASDGAYRLVEGTHVFDLKPALKNAWAQAGKPTYRDRRFRAVFQYDSKGRPGCTQCDPAWKVAVASNQSVHDVGPRNGEFESANVPPMIDELPMKGVDGAGDSYTWHVRLAELKVREILRDEDYKGPLATPGETYRLVLARIEHLPVASGSTIPPDLDTLLPGRLRCVLKYGEFNKEWKVVALDVGPAESDQWTSSNVR